MLEIKFKQLLKTLSINHKIILTFRFFIGNSLFFMRFRKKIDCFADYYSENRSSRVTSLCTFPLYMFFFTP